MVVVYKWGGIAFDDYSLAKILILPSDADDDTPITMHDEEGADYQVPVGKVFIAGKLTAFNNNVAALVCVGESGSADAGIDKEVIKVSYGADEARYDDVFGVYAAGEYVTVENTNAGSGNEVEVGAALYGVEVTA